MELRFQQTSAQALEADFQLTYKTEIESHIEKTNIWLPRGKQGRDKVGDWD